MQEQISVVGDVKVSVIKEDGHVEVMEKKNLVMREGKTILAKLLAHDGSYTSSYIDRITFGTSNTAADDQQTNLQCDAGDRKTPAAAITITYPAYNSVMFASTLLSSEGNGTPTPAYKEIGLFGVDDKMFSRIVIPTVEKTTEYRIVVEWTISFQ